jgi:RNA polymerase sigma-70 factor (ECF subfamily)
MMDLPTTTIAELLNQLGTGSEQAATRLYRHYHGYLHAFVRHQIASESDAEEIVHDVFLSVFKKPQGFQADAKFSTWLCAIARNKVIDLLRKQGRALPMHTMDEEMVQAITDPDWDFTLGLENNQKKIAIERCREALPAEQKEAIFLVFYEGLGVEAAAQRQNCPTGTVKSRLFNARKRLRDCLLRCLQGGHHD